MPAAGEAAAPAAPRAASTAAALALDPPAGVASLRGLALDEYALANDLLKFVDDLWMLGQVEPAAVARAGGLLRRAELILDALKPDGDGRG